MKTKASPTRKKFAPKTLRDFQGDVVLRHDDGSVLYFRHACFEVHGNHIRVWTEHFGYHEFYSHGVEAFLLVRPSC